MNKSDEAIWVYVVEDDDPVLRSLCGLLNAHGYKTVPCTSAEEFLKVYDPALKACMVLDLRLPGMSGTRLQTRLAELEIDIPLVIVTAHGDVPAAVQALRSGALDFIEKPAEPDRLLEAVRSAALVLNNQTPPDIPSKIVESRLSKLTDREREILNHLLQGKLNKEIAAELGISQRTVEVHRARVREKMQARGIADLIRMLT